MDTSTVAIAEIKNETCAGACSSCNMVGSCAVRTVCRCLKIAEDAIIEAIRSGGATSVRDLKMMTGAGDGCAACHKSLSRYLTVYATSAPNTPTLPSHSSSSPSMC